MIGIYQIKNIITNDMYIGQSIEIEQRWRMHIFNSKNIENKKIYNYHLYKAMRKYGLENFEFKVLLECSKEELLEKELYFFNLYKPAYNNIEPSLNPMFNDEVKKKHQESLLKDEYRRARSITSKKYWERSTDEEKKLMLSKLIIRNPTVMKPIRLFNNKESLEFDCIKSGARFLSEKYNIRITTAEQGIQRRLQKITLKPYKGYNVELINPVSTISASGE